MNSNQHSSQRSQRQLRIGEQIRHVLMEIFERGRFLNPVLFNIEGITVTEVKISPDLKNATAFIMTLGGTDMDIVLPALNDEASHIRKEMSHNLSMRHTPTIKFLFDETFNYAQRIEEIIEHQPKWHEEN